MTPWVATGFDWFVQDSWKATRKLTLEYGSGIRYGRHGTADGAICEFLPHSTIRQRPPPSTGRWLHLSGDPYNGIVLPGMARPKRRANRFPVLHSGEFDRLYHCLPEGLSQTHYGVFQPRLGLAYALDVKTLCEPDSACSRIARRSIVTPPSAATLHFSRRPPSSTAALSSPRCDTTTVPIHLTSQDPVFKVPVAWNWNTTFSASSWQHYDRGRVRRTPRHPQSAQAQHQSVAARNGAASSFRQSMRCVRTSAWASSARGKLRYLDV